MKGRIRERLRKHQRRVEARVERRGKRRMSSTAVYGAPVISTQLRTYELSERSQGTSHGGVPLMFRLAEQVGLVDAINRRVNVLKLYAPYRESDHVLNFAINAWCHGQRLEDIELRRNDEAFLDAIGAEALPDPTTAGDFCRRFRNAFSIGMFARRDRRSAAQRVVVVRKNISKEKGNLVLFDEPDMLTVYWSVFDM